MPQVAEEDAARHVKQADIDELERAIDAFTEAAGPLDHFVLPAGSETVARLHVARTVMRRAERRADALAQEAEIDRLVLAFLNRSSDLLFAAARYAATIDGAVEEAWDPTAEPARAVATERHRPESRARLSTLGLAVPEVLVSRSPTPRRGAP